MIPKVIHYCWFGRNPLPPLAIKCIDSWKKYLPDYEIKEWNEDNFDVNIIPYTAQAYQAKKYAFVSDYARFWILYKYGGIYFDTDVEVIKPIDDIVCNGAFMGIEKDYKYGITVNPGLGLGIEANHSLFKEFLDTYSTKSFTDESGNMNMQTIVVYTTEILFKHGLSNVPDIQTIKGIKIYPSEYFCPRNIVTKRFHITENTRTIHHYAASWCDKNWKKRIIRRIRFFIPEHILLFYNKTKNAFVATRNNSNKN